VTRGEAHPEVGGQLIGKGESKALNGRTPYELEGTAREPLKEKSALDTEKVLGT